MQTPAPSVDSPPTLVIIGTGRVAMTLGRLFVLRNAARLVALVGRSQASAARAVAFVGGEVRAQTDLHRLTRDARPRWFMLATPDATLAQVAQSLAQADLLRAGDGVFHLSGALPAEILAPCRAAGAFVASAHPLVSFGDPQRLIEDFRHIPCALEGDAAGLPQLQALWQAIGAETFVLAAGTKTLYHASAVLASNYLTSVLEAAIEAMVKTGMTAPEALRLLSPLVRSATENTLRLGPQAALTGPLVRGDDAVVRAHAAALAAKDAALARCYAAMTAWTAHWLKRPDPLDGAA